MHVRPASRCTTEREPGWSRTPRIFEPAETIAGAWGRVEEWLDCEPVWVPEPTERHRSVLGPFMRTVVDRPKLVPDAHLAALAIEHG
jgi:predicted nucleic acid-binding protein